MIPHGTTFKFEHLGKFEIEIKNILEHESGAHMGSIHEKNQRPKISCYCTFKYQISYIYSEPSRALHSLRAVKHSTTLYTTLSFTVILFTKLKSGLQSLHPFFNFSLSNKKPLFACCQIKSIIGHTEPRFEELPSLSRAIAL